MHTLVPRHVCPYLHVDDIPIAIIITIVRSLWQYHGTAIDGNMCNSFIYVLLLLSCFEGHKSWFRFYRDA